MSKPSHIDRAALIQAAQRIIPYVERTPLRTSEVIDEMSGARIFFKCENLQHIGAFKARGAFNALLSQHDFSELPGVATHSSGNHAQALALAAGVLGIPATIVMPSNSPKVKIAGVKRLGGTIRFCAPQVAARESELKAVLDETGALFIPPYDHDAIIAGQATATLEIFEQMSPPDAVVAPLGGGGLLSGTGLAAHHFHNETIVYGAEPTTVNDGQRSFYSGKLESNPAGAETIADGLRTHLSARTLRYIKQHVSDVLTVDENEITTAMRLIWEHLKLVVEPSAAVPLAAVLRNQKLFAGKSVAIILSGGNIDLDQGLF